MDSSYDVNIGAWGQSPQPAGG